MEKKDLCCLHKCANEMWLELAKVEELIGKNEIAKKALEINIPNGEWRYLNQDGYLQSKNWSKIGEQSKDGKFVQIVFDPTDFSQLKRAFSIASHFFSDNYD